MFKSVKRFNNYNSINFIKKINAKYFFTCFSKVVNFLFCRSSSESSTSLDDSDDDPDVLESDFVLLLLTTFAEGSIGILAYLKESHKRTCTPSHAATKATNLVSKTVSSFFAMTKTSCSG